MGIQSEEDVEHSRFVIDSEPPHANLYSYNAVLRYPVTGKAATGSVDQWAKEPVSIQETLLRGCNLRNTTWVIGIVVYTGAETKM
jgi:phospholipid-translocating ATPase